MTLRLFFFLYPKIHEPTRRPSQGDGRNADVQDDLKCRLGGFTLQLPRQALSVFVQVLHYDERRNVHCKSREFCTLVPRNLILLLQAWGCTNFILHKVVYLWFVCTGNLRSLHWKQFDEGEKSPIFGKSVTTQNLAFLSYWYRKKRLQVHF